VFAYLLCSFYGALITIKCLCCQVSSTSAKAVISFECLSQCVCLSVSRITRKIDNKCWRNFWRGVIYVTGDRWLDFGDNEEWNVFRQISVITLIRSLHDNQDSMTGKFYTVDHARGCGTIFVIRILTRDLAVCGSWPTCCQLLEVYCQCQLHWLMRWMTACLCSSIGLAAVYWWLD